MDPARAAGGLVCSAILGLGAVYFLVRAVNADGTHGSKVFVATVICWRKQAGQIVHIIFEGDLQATSQTVQAAELRLFESDAETICLSVD
jgi:hypothetical protein